MGTLLYGIEVYTVYNNNTEMEGKRWECLLKLIYSLKYIQLTKFTVLAATICDCKVYKSTVEIFSGNFLVRIVVNNFSYIFCLFEVRISVDMA